MYEFSKVFFKKLKTSFELPSKMNWGYALMLLSIGCALGYIFRFSFNTFFPNISTSSLVGFTLNIIFYALLGFIIPATVAALDKSNELIGKNTGVGILLLSALSGIPLMLISDSLHNICSWVWLRIGGKMIYPVFFCYSNVSGIPSQILYHLAVTVIPAFAMSLFFFGAFWSCFRSTDKTVCYILTAIFYALCWFNFIDFISLMAVGAWLSFLRTKGQNIFAPIICLFSISASSILFSPILGRVNITEIQTYSDISATFLYASLPSLFLGVILVLYFKRLISDFFNSYIFNTHGSEDPLLKQDNSILPVIRGVNPALLAGIIIFVVMWVYVIKGVML